MKNGSATFQTRYLRQISKHFDRRKPAYCDLQFGKFNRLIADALNVPLSYPYCEDDKVALLLLELHRLDDHQRTVKVEMLLEVIAAGSQAGARSSSGKSAASTRRT